MAGDRNRKCPQVVLEKENVTKKLRPIGCRSHFYIIGVPEGLAKVPVGQIKY